VPNGEHFYVVQEIDIAESIIGEIFTARSKINVLILLRMPRHRHKSLRKWCRVPEMTASL